MGQQAVPHAGQQAGQQAGQPAGKHEKFSNFMRQPVPVTLIPLDISSVLARVIKSMTKPASGTFTISTALRPSQGLHLATDHEYTLTSSLIFNHRRRHQTSKGFSLRISSVFIII